MALFETGQCKGMSMAETTIDYEVHLCSVVGGNDLKQRMSQSNRINQFEDDQSDYIGQTLFYGPF